MIDLKKVGILLSLLLITSLADGFDGVMDRSFGMGQSYEALPVCKSVECQLDDKKILIAGYVEAHGKKTMAVARLLENGMIDQSFGKNGICCTSFTNGETASSAHAIRVDSEGRIIVGGFTNGINNVCHACLARYHADGTLDKSFFGGRAIFRGTVISCFGSPEEMSCINSLVETDDQKIVAVGTSYENKAARFAIARYHSDGSLDKSFNPQAKGCPSGMVCTQFESSSNDQAYAVALDAYGKMVVAGSSYASGIKTFALARYHKDGSLDQSFFGGNAAMHGTVVTNFMHGETEGQAHAICIQADGKILVGGYTNAFCHEKNGTHFALARYTAQGMLDKEFGVDGNAVPGTIVTSFGSEKARSGVNALLIQTDNKIVAGGYAELNKTKYFALARYDVDGSCDYTFNEGGAFGGKVLTRSSAESNDEIFGLTMAMSGDIIAVGRSKTAALSHGAVARYLCDQNVNCPEIVAPECDAKVFDGSNMVLKGTAHNMSRITLYLDGKRLDTLPVAAKNSWEYHLPSLVDGEHQLYVIEQYENGNVRLESKKLNITVDQHPKAINQAMDCHGMRLTEGSLAARGASGNYSFRILKENNCKVILDASNGTFKVEATIPSGQASFDFEVKDSVSNCVSQGTMALEVREIPMAGSVVLNIVQNSLLEASLESFTMGGQKPYLFSLVNDNEYCKLNSDGSFVYTPKVDFIGNDEFKFIATDMYKVSSEPGCVSMHMHLLPDAKQLVMQHYANSVISGDLSSLVTSGRKPYQYALYAEKNCKVTIESNGLFSCMPDQDYVGEVSFEYVITDGYGFKSQPCQVMIVLMSQTMDCHGMRPMEGSLAARGASGNYSFRILKENNCQVALDANSGSFKVEATIPSGQASFDFEMKDSVSKCVSQSTMALEVREIPMAGSVELNIVQNSSLEANLESFTMGGQKPYFFSLVNDNEYCKLSSDGSFVYTPKVDFIGNDEFKFVATDMYKVTSEPGSVSMHMHLLPDAKQLVMNHYANSVISGDLSSLVTSGRKPYQYALHAEKNCKVTLESNGQYSCIPDQDYVGEISFEYVITDGYGFKSAPCRVMIVLISQTMDCHGIRLMEGSLAARGASETCSYRIVKENNCKVVLDASSGVFKVEATIPSGQASFDFEVKDSVSNCVSQSTMVLEVREVPIADSVELNIAQNSSMEANLESFTMGGQKPYFFSLVNDNEYCKLNSDGSFVYTPKIDFIGDDEFKFIATDMHKITSEPGCVSMHMHLLPDAKQLVMHHYANSVISGDLSLLVTSGRKPYQYALHAEKNCKVTMESNGLFSCTPDQDYVGQVSFEYVITDGYGFKSVPCQVMIVLYEALAANPEVIVGCKDTTITKNLCKFISKGSAPYRFVIEKKTDKGILKISESGLLEFKPNKEFLGQIECCIKIANHELLEPINMNLVIEIKDIHEFETTLIYLPAGKTKGSLKNNEDGNSKFSLLHSSKRTGIILRKDGKFVIATPNISSPLEFMYQETDALGNEAIKHAKIIIRKNPMALSDKRMVQKNQKIVGNLNELTHEGIPPFTYKILSAKNGKIQYDADGKYSFKPRFDLNPTAEFSYQVIDARNISSNIGKVEFCLAPEVVQSEVEIINSLN